MQTKFGKDRSKLIRIIDTYRDRQKGLRNSMIEARRNLRDALQTEPLHEEEVRRAFRDASAVKEEMSLSRARMMSEMKAVLTPEQVALWKEKKGPKADRPKRRLGTLLEEKDE